MNAGHARQSTPISVIVLTLNEEANLPSCLASVSSWALEVFIVDAGSTDRTQGIAEQFGATVVHHPFETHSKQWQWALASLPLRSEWVMALDADQSVTPELAEELAALGNPELEGVDGVYVIRRQYFRGRWIRHGGYYPKRLLKMFRAGRVVIDPGDLVDHHFYIHGRVICLQHDIIELNRKENEISFWIQKHTNYAALLAREELRPLSAGGLEPRFLGTPDQRTVALKRAWRGMPLYIRPFLYFGYRYFVRLGFLDGKQGAIFHFLQAFWFRLLVDINIDEIHRSRVDDIVVNSDSGCLENQVAKPS